MTVDRVRIGFLVNDLSRLTKDKRVKDPSGTPTTLYDCDFTYDDVGNRTAVDATNYTYHADSDKLSSDGTSAYQYDGNASRCLDEASLRRVSRCCGGDNGNTTDKGSDTFGWDWDNRLVEFDPNAGSTVSYVHDPDGNLVRRTVDSTTTTYVVDTNGELPVVLLDRTSAAIAATYVYGDDLICFHDGDRTDDRYYYFFDASRSIAAITDSLKDVRVLHECDAFGNAPFCVPLFDEIEKVSFASAGHSDLFASPVCPRAPLAARAGDRG